LESTGVGVVFLFDSTSDVLSNKGHKDSVKSCSEGETHRSHPVLERKLLHVHLILRSSMR